MRKKQKISPQNKLFMVITIAVLFVGISFGKIVNQAIPSENQKPTFEPTVSADQGDDSEESKDKDDVTQDPAADSIYLIQLGAFKTYDNVLSLVNELQRLGFNHGFVKDDEQFVVFSHIVGDPKQLEDVETILKKEKLPYFIKEVKVDTDDLKWNYFLQAVKQDPYEMLAEFIQEFTNDDLYIFGFFTTLSTASFDPLADERQEMLLRIYQWLND